MSVMQNNIYIPKETILLVPVVRSFVSLEFYRIFRFMSEIRNTGTPYVVVSLRRESASLFISLSCSAIQWQLLVR